MRTFEREPQYLLSHNYLEPVKDFHHNGRCVLASRLGYRITAAFVDQFMGRIFELPAAVFPEQLLRPETQGIDDFAAGVDAIVESQRAVALNYFKDGSVDQACPPIHALLHIMAYGSFNGATEKDPAFRALFTRENLLASEWYKQRLETKQAIDTALWARHGKAVEGISNVLKKTADVHAARVASPAYLTDLVGTLGADPSLRDWV
jgi:hypothetical protein